MRYIAKVISFVFSLAASGEALAKDCEISFPEIFLPPLSVEFQETASEAMLTFPNTTVGESIVLDLDRGSVINLVSQEKLTHLSGTKTIKFGNTVNEIRIFIADRSPTFGYREVTIITTILTEGSKPSESLLFGVLNCPQNISSVIGQP